MVDNQLKLFNLLCFWLTKRRLPNCHYLKWQRNKSVLQSFDIPFSDQIKAYYLSFCLNKTIEISNSYSITEVCFNFRITIWLHDIVVCKLHKISLRDPSAPSVYAGVSPHLSDLFWSLSSRFIESSELPCGHSVSLPVPAPAQSCRCSQVSVGFFLGGSSKSRQPWHFSTENPVIN